MILSIDFSINAFNIKNESIVFLVVLMLCIWNNKYGRDLNMRYNGAGMR